jgi:hypothetical protein
VTTSADDRTVVIPAGLPLLDAAAWVGHACWAELRVHAVLTGWMAVEDDPEATLVFWSERSDAAERAEAWHRRLPELREHPRAGFVRPSSAPVAELFDGLAALSGVGQTEVRRGALSAVLRGLRLGYHHRQELAVGPADGPLATTLVAALRSTFGVAGHDPDPTWAAAVQNAGGLP